MGTYPRTTNRGAVRFPRDSISVTTRSERLLLRDGLIELAVVDGPAPGAPAVARVLEAGLSRPFVEAALAHNLAVPLRDSLADAGWDGDMAGLDRELAELRLVRLRGLSSLVHFGAALDQTASGVGHGQGPGGGIVPSPARGPIVQ